MIPYTYSVEFLEIPQRAKRCMFRDIEAPYEAYLHKV